MSKFIPGPWVYSKHYKKFPEGHIYMPSAGEDKACIINLVAATSMSQKQLGINGELIAKAPEMYDMIEGLKKVLITVYDAETTWGGLVEAYLADIKKLQEEING